MTNIEDLRKEAYRILRLPTSAQELVSRYYSLHIQGLVVGCPYHINCGLHARDRALVGKGTPGEIERVAGVYLKRYHMDADGDVNRLRVYLLACGVGVDCSGFASWVINCITEEKLHKPIWSCLTFPTIKRKIISRVHPLESISASLLTGSNNATRIDNLEGVRPGDLVRLIHGGHVMVISEVGVNRAGHATYFEYVQSTTSYGSQAGIDSGIVVIRYPHEPLAEQLWSDPIIQKDAKKDRDDTSAVRLKFL